MDIVLMQHIQSLNDLILLPTYKLNCLLSKEKLTFEEEQEIEKYKKIIRFVKEQVEKEMKKLREDKQSFELTFNDPYSFNEGDIITTDTQLLLIVDTPKPRYDKWYFKILYYITFKQLFVYRIDYKVIEIKDIEK